MIRLGIEQLIFKGKAKEQSYSDWVEDLYASGSINHHVAGKMALLAELQDSFQCVKCGRCCREHTEIEFSMDDLKQASRKQGMNVPQFIRRYGLKRTSYEGIGVYHALKLANGERCPFFDGSECTIYEARPDVCRRYPFLTPEGVARTLQMERGIWFYGAQCEASVEYMRRRSLELGLAEPAPDAETKKKMKAKKAAKPKKKPAKKTATKKATTAKSAPSAKKAPAKKKTSSKPLASE